MDTHVIMHTDGTLTPITPKKGTTYSLEELQALVGGYIEMLPLEKNRYAVVNEEGMLHGLDLNPSASLLLGQKIVGPCVVIPRSSLR